MGPVKDVKTPNDDGHDGGSTSGRGGTLRSAGRAGHHVGDAGRGWPPAIIMLMLTCRRKNLATDTECDVPHR